MTTAAVTKWITELLGNKTADRPQPLVSGVNTAVNAIEDLSSGASVTLAGDANGPANANQVTLTHLAAPLPVAQGGTGNGTGAIAGDVTGTLAASVVSAIRGNVVKAGAATLDGQFYEYNLANADFELVGPGTLLNVQQFVASGTYTPTPGTHSVLIEAWGAGGGGGGCAAGAVGVSSAVGGGGGPGNYVSFFMNGANIAAFAIVIGAGGTAGDNTGGNNAGAGGSTTLAISTGITIPGGNPGNGQAAPTLSQSVTAAGGNGTASTLPAASANLVYLFNTTSRGGSAGLVINGATNIAQSGMGSSSTRGGVGFQSLIASAAGAAGQQPGGAGGGACVLTNVARAGGAGAIGRVIIYEYA